MSIMKYILFALLLLGLWVTEPLWMKRNANSTDSSVNTKIVEQKNHRTEKLTSESEKIEEFEQRFGPKPYGRYSTGVPSAVYEYWNKTLTYPDALKEERCGPVRTSSKGWLTVCRYRVKNKSGMLELRQDTFIIKDGVAYK